MNSINSIERNCVRVFFAVGILGMIACQPTSPSQKNAESQDVNSSDSVSLQSGSEQQKQDNKPHHFYVEIKEMKFIPENVIVQKGDTILFTNKDFVVHDVTEINKKWTSGELKPGDQFVKVATKSEDYYCSIHVIMKGKITVN